MTQTKIGHKIIHLERVDSTNNYTANLSKNGQVNHGTVILADMQTNGRGQRGNVWQSDPFANLTMTLYLEAHHKFKYHPHLVNYIVSLALKDVLSNYAEGVKIKWPNDILIGRKKISGILIENQWGSSGINASIVGIGINLNQSEFEGSLSTSLFNEVGKNFQPYDVMLNYCAALQKRWNSIATSTTEKIKKEFDGELWLKGEESTYIRSSNNEEFLAILVGTDEEGNLLLQKENGQIESFRNQSVRFKKRIPSGN